MPNIDQDMRQSGDILSTLDGVSKRTDTQTKLLSSIDANLGQLIQEFSRMSSANAINSYGDGKGGYSYGRSNVYSKRMSRQRSSQGSDIDDTVDEITSGITSRVANSILNNRGLNNIVSSVINDLKRPIRDKMESSVYDLLDGIEHSLKRGAGSADISKRIKSSLESLASDLGVETKDIGKGIGKLLGQKLLQNADVKAVADFSKQFAQTQIRNIRAAYQSGKAGQIQDMPDLIRRQSLRESLSDIPKESEKEEFLRRTGKSGIGLTNAREELLRQNAEKARTKYIGDPSDLSETEVSGSSKSSSDRNNDTQSQINSANELAINAQSCIINTDNLDINIEGSGLDRILNRRDESDVSNDSDSDSDSDRVTLSDIDQVRGSSDNKPFDMPDISSELSEIGGSGSPTDRNRYARTPENEYADYMSRFTESEQANADYLASQIAAQRLSRFDTTDPRMRSIASNNLNQILDLEDLDESRSRIRSSGKSSGYEMDSITIDDTKKSKAEFDSTLSDIGDSGRFRRSRSNSQNSEMTDISDVSGGTESLGGLENVVKYLQGGLSDFMHSNVLTGKAYDLAESSGSSLFGGIKDMASSAFGKGKSKYLSEIDLVQKGAMSASDMSGLGGMISTLTGGATEAGAALSGATSAIAALGPAAIAAAGAFVIVGGALKKSLEPAIEGIKKAADAASTSMHRTMESARKNVENSQKRIMDDVRTLVETPFNILKEAAQDWYNAWDSNIRTINATQGYTKADLQDLMASFAERLRSEGLTSVVAATDITNNLTKVLQSGLSGQIAEEFAYLATKLNAAVPTQDFFSYADTYASIAANAVRAGATQSAAIEEASQQLIAFANNVLYASREVAGGFTTGLQNAESLFKQSVQISQAAKSYNASEISGVMTSVSAIVGAIAPDVASSLTDAIYKAAVGGNSNEIVALRSLAGINASNTEFLQQIATDAKTVFSDLFEELGKRQNMSESGYMEVAEGLSSIFGLSMDAFARVDFNYLAQAIESMDTSSAALSNNIMLLASGETTTNAEQLKMQEINKLILDEGLSYVLDNEAARSIQEHMWDEQLARQLQETEYGVNLHGAALEALEGIKATINLILDILNPIRLIGRLADLKTTWDETNALRSDIQSVLELGKVGSGNAQQLYNLTHTNEDLGITDNLVSMLGGSSKYSDVHDKMNSGVEATNFLGAAFGPIGAIGALTGSLLSYDVTGRTGRIESPSDMSEYGTNGEGGSWGSSFNIESRYNWSSIGKSIASSLSSESNSLSSIPDRAWSDSSSSSNADDYAMESMQSMLDSMSGFVNANRSASYEDWVNTSRSYGIADYEKALEQAGLTQSQVEAQFNMLQAQIGAREKVEREAKEESFWKDTTDKTSEISAECTAQKENYSDMSKFLKENMYGTINGINGNIVSVKTPIDAINGKIIDDTTMRTILTSTIASPVESKFNAVIQNELTSIGWLSSLSKRLETIESILTNGSIDVHDSGLLQELINLHTNLVVDGDSTQNQIIRQLETLITMLQSSGGSTLARLPFSLFALSGAANN